MNNPKIFEGINSADAALSMASGARLAGQHGLEEQFLQYGISLDRSNQRAYLEYADLLLQNGRFLEATVCLSEAHRIEPLQDKFAEAYETLTGERQIIEDAGYRSYQDRISRRVGEAQKKLRILVVTNLLPPQEMGGFGRTIWEFADQLQKRGHVVKVLCADMPHLNKETSAEHIAFEKHVERSLQLFGDWRGGRTLAEPDINKRTAIIHHNRRQVIKAIEEFKPEVCMVGNLDFVGVLFFGDLVGRGIPILHRLGNAHPSYSKEATPKTKMYMIAGCSNWLNASLKDAGYDGIEYDVVYPGSPINEYYKFFNPSFSKLRICFASLLMAYKGAHLLVGALIKLHQQNVPFECEIAGDSTDVRYIENLKDSLRKAGCLERVKFLGFLGKKELGSLFARSNVLIFPSVFNEPFGKTQIEAMSAGCLVVTSGTGGSREIIRDGENGLVFEKNNANHLAERLTWISGNADKAAILAKSGKDDSFNFSTSRSVQKIERLFSNLIKGKDVVASPVDSSEILNLNGLKQHIDQATSRLHSISNDIIAKCNLPVIGSGNFIPWTGSAIRPSALNLIMSDIVIHSRSYIVEIGAGVSTLYFAYLAQERGFKLISIDADHSWQGIVLRQLDELGIDKSVVSMIHAPLKAISTPFGDVNWYDFEIIKQSLPGCGVDLLLVDGPIAAHPSIRYSRYPALPLFMDFMAPNFSVFIDDCNREGEQTILRRWANDFHLTQMYLPYHGSVGILYPANSKRFNIL